MAGRFLLVSILSVFALGVRAEVIISGTVINGPSEVKVRLNDGSFRRFRAPLQKNAGLSTSTNQPNDGLIFLWGHTTRSFFDSNCPRNLGRLAEAINVTVQLNDGSQKQVTILGATEFENSNLLSVKPGGVHIIADCNTSAEELSGFKILTTSASVVIK